MRLYALISNLSYQIIKAEGGELRGVPRPYAYIGLLLYVSSSIYYQILPMLGEQKLDNGIGISELNANFVTNTNLTTNDTKTDFHR